MFSFLCSRSSRAALFDDLEEGGLRTSSSYSRDINERDNDKAAESLHERVTFLKKVSSISEDPVLLLKQWIYSFCVRSKYLYISLHVVVNFTCYYMRNHFIDCIFLKCDIFCSYGQCWYLWPIISGLVHHFVFSVK